MKYQVIGGLVVWLIGGWLVGAAHTAVVGSTDDAMPSGGGARPIGMARAFTAIADDADAPFINPAGIGNLKGPQAMAMYTNLLGDVYYNEFCGALPTPYGTVGAGYITTGVSNIPTGAVSTDYYDSLLLVSYSVPLARFFNYGKNVFVGANYKIFNRGYTGGVSQFGSGMSVDAGALLIVSPNLSIGVCRQNLLPVSLGGVIRLNGGAEESLFSITKIGVAVKPTVLPKLLIALDEDLPMQTGRPVTSHLGFEWKENKYLSLRAGLDQGLDPATATQTSWDPSFGTSLSYGGLRVDYAYHQHYNDPSLATSYVSLSYQGEPWFALRGKAN